MDVWEVSCSSCSGLDWAFLMDVGSKRAVLILTPFFDFQRGVFAVMRESRMRSAVVVRLANE